MGLTIRAAKGLFSGILAVGGDARRLIANPVCARRATGIVARALDAAGIDMPFDTQVLLSYDQSEEDDGKPAASAKVGHGNQSAARETGASAGVAGRG